MSLPKHFNLLMASAISFSIAIPQVGFTPAFAQNAPAAEAPGDNGWQKEFELWRTSNKGGKVADYQKYLKDYPNGKFANVAKRRIEELNTAAASTTTKVEQTAAVETTSATRQVADADGKSDLDMWRQVSKTGQRADYENYLKAFPEGKFAKVAKTRIDTLGDSSETTQDVAAKSTQVAAPAEDDQQMAAQADDQMEAPADDQSQAEAPTDEVETAQATDAQANDKPAGADWEQEYALWKAASDGNTVTEYEAYLRAYPDGKFAAIAQARVAQLAAAEQPDPTISEGDQQQDDPTTAKTNVARDRKQNNNSVEPADDQRADQNFDQQDDQGQDQDFADQGQDDGQDDQGGMDNNRQASSNSGSRMGNDQSARNNNQAEQFTEGNEDTEDASLDVDTRHEIQGRLSSLGYDTQGTDGIFGSRSRDAIASWQQDNGAPVTGYLSDDQVNAIFAASAASYATWLANRTPVRVRRVRPRAEWVVVRPRSSVIVVRPRARLVVRNRPNVVVVKPFKNRFKNRVRVKMKFNGGCRKRRRC